MRASNSAFTPASSASASVGADSSLLPSDDGVDPLGIDPPPAVTADVAPVRRPALVDIIVTAIAAGIAGRQLVLNFSGFPAAELAEICGHVARWLCADDVFAVHESADLKHAENRLKSLRLVAVYRPELLRRATNRLGSDRIVSRCSGSRPAIISLLPAFDVEDISAAVLNVYCRPTELLQAMAWIRRTCPLPDWATCIGEIGPIEAPEPVQRLFMPTLYGPGAGLHRLRDCDVFRAALTGISLLRHIQQGRPDLANGLSVSMDDYCMVRQLLQDPMFQAADESYDVLTVAMVERANAFLAMRAETAKITKRPRLDTPVDLGLRQVTRAELLDLGDPNRSVVRELVKSVRLKADGLKTFEKMGASVTPSCDAWSTAADFELARLLISWTYKQVRDRFDKLVGDGRINAQRRSANGPWEYRLPERLAEPGAVFHRLPPPMQLMAGCGVGADGAESHRPANAT